VGRRHLVLDKRSRQRRLVWGETAASDLTFGERLEVKHGRGRLLWVRIRMERTAAGRAAAAVFRGPVPYVRVELANGTERWHRIVPGMARSGFLLSPLVDDTRAFSFVLEGSWPERLDEKRIRSLSFASEFGEDWYWKPTIRVEIQELNIE
jgi:hypothetical protein